MPASEGLDRSARSGERTRGVVASDKVKAADPLCAPHLAAGESVKAVTTVQGTAMCEAHARDWFGEVSTRG